LGELPWAKAEIPVAFVPALFILLLAPEFYQPLRQLGNDYHAKAQAEAAALALKPLWLLPPMPELRGSATVMTTPPPASMAAQSAELIADSAPAQPHIHLQQIHLGSATQPRLCIEHLQIDAGERLLLCGDSGSGKSSLLQLLAGFADFRGDYQFAGRQFYADNRAELWSQLSYLTQTPELFAGSVADNLRMAQPAATDAALLAVLSQVGLLVELSGELHAATALAYRLGEAGQGLSGGQQQRLCLARLLLADRPLWLLDEPFAELDQETAADLAALLAQLSVGRTLLIASHQWQLLGFLDGALWLNHGALVRRCAIADLNGAAGSISQGALA
jgi:ATP-binding cassette subfamily C protein CydD